MSEKIAHTLAGVVAANIKRWRVQRGLDQQALADRLGQLGWQVDRTTITRIEHGERKVTVDDLGMLAAALNVPLTVMLIPVFDGGDVTLTPSGRTNAVNRWWLFEWMIGNEPLPGPIEAFGGEWQTGAEPLWLYERVRHAQQRTATSHPAGDEPAEWLEALQVLVDAVAAMELYGIPARDLIGPERRKAAKSHRIEPSPAPRRFELGHLAEEGSK